METVETGHDETESVFLAPADAPACVGRQQRQSPAHQDECAPEHDENQPEKGFGRTALAARVKNLRLKHKHQTNEDMDQRERTTEGGDPPDYIVKDDQ